MRSWRVLLAICTLLIGVMTFCWPIHCQKESTTVGGSTLELAKLRATAMQAKLLGRQSVDLPAPSSPEIVERSLDKAIEHFSVLCVEPYSKQTVSVDGGLFTWYKCRLPETLSVAAEPAVLRAPTLSGLSQEVL